MAHRGNDILETLSAASLELLRPEVKEYPITTVLIDEGEVPQSVFFPHRGAVVSIVRATADGSMVEAGVIGGEGLLTLKSVITASAPSEGQAVVQIGGRFSVIETVVVRQYFLEDESFRSATLAFTSAFLEQVTQNLLCNRLHAIEQRLAKWLLNVRERTASDELTLTHEFLSYMLGIHRPGVSIAVTALELDGLIVHGRNRIGIRDREGLVKKSCECYPVLSGSLAALRANVPV